MGKKAKKLSKKEKELKEKEEEAAALKALSSEMNNVAIKSPPSVNPWLNEESEPVLIVKKRQWVPEGKKQETIMISICNHFRKEIGEKRRKVMNKIKNNNKMRNNPTQKAINIGKAAKEMADALKK